MIEMYLLTKVGELHSIGVTVAFLAAVIALGMYFCSITYEDWSDEKCFKKSIPQLRKAARKFLIISIIGALIAAIVPTRKDALMIYGIGTTIDYLQQNETAKQLPDKCIEALNSWVEELNKGKE